MKKAAIIESLTNGCTMTAACKGAKVPPKTYYQWLKEDEKFADAVTKALACRVQIVEDALFTKACKGHPTAMIFWLVNRARERWADVRKVEHGGEVKVTTFSQAVEALASCSAAVDDAPPEVQAQDDAGEEVH